MIYSIETHALTAATTARALPTNGTRQERNRRFTAGRLLSSSRNIHPSRAESQARQRILANGLRNRTLRSTPVTPASHSQMIAKLAQPIFKGSLVEEPGNRIARGWRRGEPLE